MIQASYLINSALYVAMVFTAGLVWDRHLAALFSIVTAALAVFCADQLLVGNKKIARVLILLSWLIGIIAVILLVWP
jgi:hypothetical protein